MITTEEAKRTQIGGWDVYLSDHIMYVNDVNRIQSAARLCEQAFMIVHDSYVFKLKKQRESEVMEWKKWISSGGILGKDPTPSSEAGMIQLRNWQLDSFKIGTALELGVKAALLINSILVHRLRDSHSLFKKQKKHPIEFGEFHAVSQSYHNGKYNLYPDLSENTLPFSLFLENRNYASRLGVSDENLKFIDESRKRRNIMHLPTSSGEAIETPFISSLGESYIHYLCELLNEIVVNVYNTHNWRQDILPKFQ